ncbi:MAG TPA: RHS repeat-associated core domain-containing protein, partial [Chryseolinea sp.]|nr:RHS repeat-associated core domain-containing protein [Chryseolinea sp.]
DAAWDQVGTPGAQTSATVKQPPHDVMTVTAKAPEAGYAYVFVSNEHPFYVDLYFDDVTLSHTPSPIVGVSDFFPFGLTFNSYTRENTVPNKYLFQEKEIQSDLNLNLYDFDWRQYDATIGRTITQDPHADLYWDVSPYSFLVNNPFNTLDPTGMDTLSSKAAGFDWNSVKEGDVVDGNTVLPSVVVQDDGTGDPGTSTVPSDATANSNLIRPIPEPPTHTLRQWEPSFAERWEMADDPISNLTYNTADNVYVTMHIFMPWKSPTHISAQPVQGYDGIEAFAGTAMLAQPYMRQAKALGTVNATQFSSKFRGTFITRMSPPMRGRLNRAYNSQFGAKPGRNSTVLTKLIASLVGFFTGEN